MDDGRHLTISHPDFAFAANDWLILAGSPKADTSADGLTMLPFSHISGIHITKKKSKTAA